MLKVMQMALTFSRGGRWQAIRNLVEGLREYGVASDLVSVEELGCDREEIAGLVGVAQSLARSSLLEARVYGRLIELCKECGTDVIHAHDAASHFTAALVRTRLPRLKLLMTFHRSRSIESRTRPDRLRNAYACALSHAVVTGSRERRAHFVEHNYVAPRKVIRIPFGIDTRRFRPDRSAREQVRAELGLGPDTVVIGAVGHFGAEKGVDVALRAFAALQRRGTSRPTALVVLGDAAPAADDELRRLAAEAPGPVIFGGFRTDVERWFCAFDIFLHAPRMEAFGLVLAEAMATGLPVVGTKVGGVPDVVIDGISGLLVPPERPDALAEALALLVDDPGRRARMAIAGREIAEAKFGVDLYARRYAALYRDLLDGRPPGGVDRDTEDGPLSQALPADSGTAVATAQGAACDGAFGRADGRCALSSGEPPR